MATTISNPGYIAVEGANTDLAAAMFDAVGEFAGEAGLPNASDLDVIMAARQPVSMAAAYCDLCQQLGVPVPRFIRLALG